MMQMTLTAVAILFSKYSTRYLTLALLPMLLALCLSTPPSFAQDLVDTTKTSEETDYLLDGNIQTIPTNNQPESAATLKINKSTKVTASNAMTEAKKLSMEERAMAHLKAMLSVRKKEVAIKQVSPYEQLVKLAFKGKGVNGINSYQDAAVVFCKQARDDDNAEAQFALGWMHANGKGVNKDNNVAAFFFNKAAAQNHHRAKKSLIDFKGDEALAQTPECMLPETPPEPVIAESELAPAGSNGNDFYQRGPIFKMVNRLAPQYHIETDLAMAFIKVESNFNPKATSPKNAQGLMQLIPATAKRFNVKNPYNPEDNIKGGLAYLQWLMAYFQGDVRLVAAAYNAGEGAVNRYKGVPPYRETKNYVKKIYKLYRKSYHPFQENLLTDGPSDTIQVSSKN